MTDSDLAQARAVLQRFIDAGLARDESTMRACLTPSSLEAGKFNPDAGPPPGADIQIGEPAIESGTAVVFPMLGREPGSAEFQPMLNVLVVKASADWKVDLATSLDRMMGAMMEGVGAAVQTVMEGVGEALDGALGQAFGGNGSEPPTDWSTASLEIDSAELLPSATLKEIPELTATFSEAVGSAVTVLADMDAFRTMTGYDTDAEMRAWFISTLFANWPESLRKAAEITPLKNRLRAVRLEAASSWEHRFLALDGSDLVYRLHFPTTAGYYPDHWVDWLLPAILPALAERIDPRTAGQRTLLADDERGDLDLYLGKAVPRFMRRISTLLGRNIALDADWASAYDPASAARQFQRFGLNRIYGAIARALLDPDVQPKLATLTRIKCVIGYSDERFVKFADGALELTLPDTGGERMAAYEAVIYSALSGEDIRGNAGCTDETSIKQQENQSEPAT